MLCLSGPVLSNTRVVSRMTRLYGFDRQEADLLSIASDQNSVTSPKSVVVEQPYQFDRSISFGNGASDRRRAVDIERFLPELERHDDRKNLRGLRRGIKEGKVINLHKPITRNSEECSACPALFRAIQV